MTRTHRLTIASLCTLVLLVLPGWALRHERHAEVEVRMARLAALEQHNSEIRAENDALLGQVTSLNEGGESTERSVRERLGWVAPNETVVLFESADQGTP